LDQTIGFPDINATINMSGGTMTVSDASSCVWGYGAPANVTMSGGVLDIICSSMSITSSYSVTENITGGTIRIPNDLTLDNSVFTPIGGTIELYGPNNAYIRSVACSMLILPVVLRTFTVARETPGS